MMTSDEFEVDKGDCSEGRSPDDIQTRIWSALGRLETPSAFVAGSHTATYTNPGLYVKNHGMIGLPLSEHDAKAIIAEAKQSPFGKREHTVIDTDVRKSWELDAHEISLQNPAWNGQVQQFLQSVCTTLGLTPVIQTISAQLYKLLLYEPGGIFKPHRDSEKTPGMFGTLMICLPSKHEGGKLVLEHAGERYDYETEGNSDFGISFAAWYSDVNHQIMQVTSGYRLVLTYNLVRKPCNGANFQEPLLAPNLSTHKTILSDLLRSYSLNVKQDTSLPRFLVHKLEHKYTQASLKEASLKGSDVSILQVLKELRQQCDIDLYLATLEVMVNKDDEGNDEEYDRSESLSHLVELDGSLLGSDVSLADATASITDPRPRDEEDEEDADEVERSGYTGNEGATATFWYRDTVVVIVPRIMSLEFICNGGIFRSKALSLLRTLVNGYPAEQHKRQDILQLCRFALRHPGAASDVWYGGYRRGDKEDQKAFFNEAAAAMLEVNAFELFQEACTKTLGNAAVTNAVNLGAVLMRIGFQQTHSFLEQGIRAVKSLAARYEFMLNVERGMQSYTSTVDNDVLEEFRLWSEEILKLTATESKPLTKADAVALASISKTKHWPRFEGVLEGILMSDETLGRIAFLNSFLCNHTEMDEPQLEFGRRLTTFVWSNFEYTCCAEPAPQGRGTLLPSVPATTKFEFINATDLKMFIGYSQALLKSFDFEKQMLPVLLKAIHSSLSEASALTSQDLIKAITINKFPPMTCGDWGPPPLHKLFVQSLFKIGVGDYPSKPRDWALPPGNCGCGDCCHINRFLTDPVRTQFDFPCSKVRRRHLDGQFTYIAQKSYEVETIRYCNPNKWRITKNRNGYEKARSEWNVKWQAARALVESLTKDEENKDRLVAYLHPYFDAFTSMRVEHLPNIDPTSSIPLGTISGNASTRASVASNKGTTGPPTTRKRGLSETDTPIETMNKKVNFGIAQSENLAEGQNTGIEIVDLTDL